MIRCSIIWKVAKFLFQGQEMKYTVGNLFLLSCLGQSNESGAVVVDMGMYKMCSACNLECVFLLFQEHGTTSLASIDRSFVLGGCHILF